jgi:AcrR family transcriptional regulator
MAASPDHRPRVAAQRRESMRARLLDAGLATIVAHGVAGTSIDEIISAAQVSRGTFYKYFDSVTGLAAHLAQELAHEMGLVLDPLVTEEPDPALRVAVGSRMLLHFVRHGVLSVEGLVGSNVIALTSVVVDLEEERGDPYRARFGQRFAENALKTSGAFAGTLLTGEDPRRRPPYLVLKGPRPSGFLPRTGLALKENLLAYRCDAPCTGAEHVRTGLSAGRILGSAASAVLGEFTPELTAGVKRSVGALFRRRWCARTAR